MGRFKGGGETVMMMCLILFAFVGRCVASCVQAKKKRKHAQIPSPLLTSASNVAENPFFHSAIIYW